MLKEERKKKRKKKKEKNEREKNKKQEQWKNIFRRTIHSRLVCVIFHLD